MTTILGISGSLRRGSFNAALLRLAGTLMPEGARIETGTIRGVPLYDADEEAQGVPQAVALLRRQLAAADGLLLVTPEYNNGIPGVFKNAIDWVSSNEGAALFRGKPVALIGASATAQGTVLAQAHWLPVLHTLRTRPWLEGRLTIPRARSVFDGDGTLTDPELVERLRVFLAGFTAAVQGRAVQGS